MYSLRGKAEETSAHLFLNCYMLGLSGFGLDLSFNFHLIQL